MEDKMQEIYQDLTEENKDILNMLAKAVQLGQQNAEINQQEK